jgi:hypothetical protein
MAAREEARWAQQHATEEAEAKRRYDDWSNMRTQAGVGLLHAWHQLYARVIATNNVELVQIANRLHQATTTVIDHLLDESADPDYWPEEWIGEFKDPLEDLPELLEEVVSGRVDRAQIPPTSDSEAGVAADLGDQGGPR